jgi:hypothetical protein
MKTTRTQRVNAMSKLWDQLSGSTTFAFNMRAEMVEWSSMDDLYHVRMASGETVSARAVVLATGRLGPLTVRGPFPTAFRRLEVGRQTDKTDKRQHEQTKTDNADYTRQAALLASADFLHLLSQKKVGVRLFLARPLATLPSLNPTHIWRVTLKEGTTVEFRSFCWCVSEKGRCVAPNLEALGLNMTLLSGTTDDPPESRPVPLDGPNVGLMLRVYDEADAPLCRDMERFAREAVFILSERDFASLPASPFHDAFLVGLEQFKAAIPELEITGEINAIRNCLLCFFFVFFRY